MFIATLFIITKTWKQLRCPSVGEWINKQWYICIIEYYSVIKRNELLGASLVAQWLGLRASNQGLQVQSLVRELRSHMLCGAAKIK